MHGAWLACACCVAISIKMCHRMCCMCSHPMRFLPQCMQYAEDKIQIATQVRQTLRNRIFPACQGLNRKRFVGVHYDERAPDTCVKLLLGEPMHIKSCDPSCEKAFRGHAKSAARKLGCSGVDNARYNAQNIMKILDAFPSCGVKGSKGQRARRHRARKSCE